MTGDDYRPVTVADWWAGVRTLLALILVAAVVAAAATGLAVVGAHVDVHRPPAPARVADG